MTRTASTTPLPESSADDEEPDDEEPDDEEPDDEAAEVLELVMEPRMYPTTDTCQRVLVVASVP